MTRPLVLLHGFTQTAASFDPLRATLSAYEIDTVVPELPGHGTGAGPDRLVTGDLWAGAHDLVAKGHQGIWVGYSMGARLALHVVLAHPEAVTGLALIGGTAGIEDASERRQRRDHDETLAQRIETVGTEGFLDEWLSLDLFSTLPEDPDRKARRATNSATGLASSLRRWGTGTMDPPLWDRLGGIEVPTLVMAGALDAKFTNLGRRLTNHIAPNADFRPIHGAGHAAHLEQPQATAQMIVDWMHTARPSRPDPQ